MNDSDFIPICNDVKDSIRLAKQQMKDNQKSLLAVLLTKDITEEQLKTDAQLWFDFIMTADQHWLDTQAIWLIAMHGYDDDPRELYEIPEAQQMAQMVLRSGYGWVANLVKDRNSLSLGNLILIAEGKKYGSIPKQELVMKCLEEVSRSHNMLLQGHKA